MPALGDEFRSAREARGLTLSDVAERLHIRDVYLAAIENEEWSTIGAPVYIRGFLRTYARFLGLDPEGAVARFSASAPTGPPPRSVDVTKAIPGTAAAARTARERSGPSLPALFAILVALALLGVVAYEYYQYRAEPPVAGAPKPAASATVAATAAPAAATPAALAAAPDASASASPAPAETATAAASPAVKRGLTLHLTQPSWLRITVDGNVREEGTFPAGTTRTFGGKSVLVRVGNAGGVEVSVNGDRPAVLGAPGDVVERQYTLSGG